MWNKASIAAVAVISATLSGCYVMPVDHYQAGAPTPGIYTANTAIVPMAAVRPVYTARLYPANDAASRMGPVSGVITNPEQGHGQFTFALGGEMFSGEATRSSDSSKGLANATGNRGGYARCAYAMRSSVLGNGSCTFSNGARYDMHITQ